MENSTTSKGVSWSQYYLAGLTTIHCLIFIVGILGNSLVIYVVGRFSCMQTVTNIHLMSLSIADTLYLLSMPFMMYNINNHKIGFPNSIVLCKVFWFCSTVNWFAGTFALTAVSCDRYMAVVYPFKTIGIRTPKHTIFIVVALWVFAIGLMSPVLLNTVLSERPQSNGTAWLCNQDWHGTNRMVAFTTYTFTFGYVIPCILIVFFYSMVIHRFRTAGPENKSKEKKESQKKTTRLVLAVILVYIFCWMPYWIQQLRMIPTWLQSGDNNSTLTTRNIGLNSTNSSSTDYRRNSARPSIVNYILTHAFQVLGYFNSAVNPVLYSFMSQNFRKSFARVFTCRFLKDFNNEPPVTTHVSVNRKFSAAKTNINATEQIPMLTATPQPQSLKPRDDVVRNPLVNGDGEGSGKMIQGHQNLQETEIV